MGQFDLKQRFLLTVESLAKKTPPEWRFILLWFVVSRIVLTVIGVVSRGILDPVYPRHPDWSYSPHLWLDIWGIWDTGWYVNIATHGYEALIANGAEGALAFFPLYPMLMRLGGTIFGDPFIAGLLISNIFLLISCFYLYKLTIQDYGERAARNAVKFLLLFPTAFIFSGAFTESLFLGLSLIVFYQAKKENWLGASLAGFFLSLTRPFGVMVFLPLVYLYFRERNFCWRKTEKNIIFLILIPLGITLYSLFNYLIQDDFLAFFHSQSDWGRELSNPISEILNGLMRGFTKGFIDRGFTESVFSICALLLLIFSFRKVEFAYWIHAFYSILIPLSFGGPMSMPRLILVAFPIYIYLAHTHKKQGSENPLLISTAFLQCVLMPLWCTGVALIV